MTHEEVYQELERDRDAVTAWWRHTLYAQRRRVLKAQQLPLKLWFEYTSHRKVQYLFFTRIMDKRMRTILTGIVALRRDSNGLTAYTTWLSDQMHIAPMVLTPHVWKRYAERAKVSKTGTDLLRHYFDRNPHGCDSYNQKAVARSVRYNGETHMSVCVNDGVLLGQQHSNHYLAKTFITYDMCRGLQQEEFEACRKLVMTDTELYKAFTPPPYMKYLHVCYKSHY